MLLTEFTPHNPKVLGSGHIQSHAWHVCLACTHSWIGGLWYLGKMHMVSEVLLAIASPFVTVASKSQCLIRRDGERVLVLSLPSWTFLARVDPSHRLLQQMCQWVLDGCWNKCFSQLVTPSSCAVGDKTKPKPKPGALVDFSEVANQWFHILSCFWVPLLGKRWHYGLTN